uniref:Uncharacterized protein n=1 Tax=Rhizophora mucronata TaxID=61149 RepID=A0A2P2QUD0_RHIMU
MISRNQRRTQKHPLFLNLYLVLLDLTKKLNSLR